MMYTANENEEVQAVLVLTGQSSVNITVYISTTDITATGKHSFYSFIIKINVVVSSTRMVKQINIPL